MTDTKAVHTPGPIQAPADVPDGGLWVCAFAVVIDGVVRAAFPTGHEAAKWGNDHRHEGQSDRPAAALRISARAGSRTHTCIHPATYAGWRDAWNECVRELGKDAVLTEQRILPMPELVSDPDRPSPGILARLVAALRWSPDVRPSNLERW